ncbi:hypothetical protein NE237_024523 [Protea cynaroides]|uniref:Uncharacterized protein n=1 Tax=Protea cynaroides TaxID=273540 RepID=A0A9Q0H060_9MAGN|nr:hypothetical protein NE237_024523 [Protea cynaroides]
MDDQMHDLFAEIESECYISPDQEELLRRSEFCKSRFHRVNPERSSGVDPELSYGNESINRKFGGETGVDPVKARGDSSSVKPRISGEFLDGTRAPACGAHLDNVAERSGDSALRKNFGLLKRIAEENVNLQSGGLGGDVPVGTESVDTGFKETATKGVSPLKATDKESSVRRGKEVRSSLEGGSSKKSEPPALIGGPVQNAAKRLVPDSSSSKNPSLDPLMDAITELSGGENATADPPENVDILETFKRRGMTFPRPRWWPPEGF